MEVLVSVESLRKYSKLDRRLASSNCSLAEYLRGRTIGLKEFGGEEEDEAGYSGAGGRGGGRSQRSLGVLI